MSYQLVHYIIIAALIATAFYLFWSGSMESVSNLNIRFKRNRYKEFKDTFKEQFHNNDTDTVFREAGLKISGLNYQVIRYTIVVLWLLYLSYLRLYTFGFSRTQVFIFLAVFLVTSPRKTFAGRRTPLIYILGIFQNDYKQRKNSEIYRALSQLKNLSIAKAGEKLSSDYILEELMRFTKITKPIFNRMLSMWYSSDQEKACEYFANAIGTKEGRELANMFKKLDFLDPYELKEQISLFQSAAKATRQTEKEKKNEWKSYGIYSIAIFAGIMVFINLIVVCIVIDALDYYKNLFLR